MKKLVLLNLCIAIILILGLYSPCRFPFSLTSRLLLLSRLGSDLEGGRASGVGTGRGEWRGHLGPWCPLWGLERVGSRERGGSLRNRWILRNKVCVHGRSELIQCFKVFETCFFFGIVWLTVIYNCKFLFCLFVNIKGFIAVWYDLLKSWYFNFTCTWSWKIEHNCD